MDDVHVGIDLLPANSLLSGSIDPLKPQSELKGMSSTTGSTSGLGTDVSLAPLESSEGPPGISSSSSSKGSGSSPDGTDLLTGLSDTTAVFSGSDRADRLFLRASADSLLEFSTDGAKFTTVDDLTFSSATRITADLAGGDDSLFLDGSLIDALTGSGGTLIFEGGKGNDTLFGPKANTTWNIAGENAGNLARVVEFSGTENLTGAGGNEDTFVFAKGASLSGLVDGSTGGFDSLVIAGGKYDRGIYKATSPDAGVIHLDNLTIAYSGLEPIIDNSVTDNRVFTGTNVADQIRVTPGAKAGTMTIRSDNTTFESLTFAIPSASLTINPATGADTIAVDSFGSTFTAPLTVVDPDDVSLGNITLVGNLSVSAVNSIKVPNGATISSQGDISLNVTNTVDLTFSSGNPFFKQKQSGATIDIGDATITGRNVSVTTQSSTAKTANLTQNLVHDTRAVALGDVNGDGKLDMVVGNADAPTELYLNNSTSNPFKNVNAINITGTNQTYALALGDVNGDSKLDLIIGNFTGPSQLLLNNGTANPFTGVTPINVTSNQPTISVALGDVNGDGKLDLVLGNDKTPSQLFLNNGTASPFSSNSQTFGADGDATTSVAVADVNGDGKLDLIQGRSETESLGGAGGNLVQPTRLFLNNGTATPFSNTAQNIGSGTDATLSVALGDVNADGRVDLILGNARKPSRLFFNNGTATPFSNTAQNIGSGSDATTAVKLADVNGDNKLDLILANFGQPNRLFLNNGTATPFSGTSTEIGGSWQSLAVGNLNGDSKQDIVAVAPVQVPALYLNNGTANPFKDVSATLVLPESQLATQINESVLLQFSLIAAAVQASATATVTVGSGAKITATNNVKLLSNALSNAQNTTIGAYLGATYASSTPTATVTLKGDGVKGAQIQAGASFDMQALVNNTVQVSTFVPNLPTLLASKGGGGFAGDIAFSYAKAISNSIADVQKGASVKALNANVLAKNTNTFENTASALGFQATGPIGFGVTVVISDFNSTATASMNGAITTTGDTAIDARSINLKNVTRSSASVSGPVQNKDFATNGGKNISDLGTKLASLGGKFQLNTLIKFGQSAHRGGGQVTNFIQKAQNDGVNLQVAAAVTVVGSNNTVNAFIGEGAKVFAGGNATVNAIAENNPQSSASASAGDANKGSVGGGINVASYTNKADAYIGKNATVDAGQQLLVNAEGNIVRKFNFVALNLSLPSGQTQTNEPKPAIDAAWQGGTDTLSLIKSVVLDGLVGGILSPASGLGTISTTLAHSGATVNEGGKAGVAGSVTVLDVDNGSQAYIAEGAQINQNLKNPSTAQDVKVNAFSNIATLNIAGQAAVLSFPYVFGGAQGGDVGVGGSVDVVTHKNAATAFIADKAKVSAIRDVEVKVSTFNYLIALAQAGSKSERLGIDGAISFATIENNATAYIEDQATVNAGRNVLVNASDSVLAANGTGGLGIGGNAGIGISGSINKINTTVRAFIGNANNSVGNLGSVSAKGNVSVTDSSSQQIFNVSLAGGFALGYRPPSPNYGQISEAQAQKFFKYDVLGQKQFGFGLAGDAALNFVTADVQAYIRNSGKVTAGNQLNVNATNTSVQVAVAGAVAFGSDLGIGGSFTLNYLDKTTYAFTENVEIQAGNISLSAISQAPAVVSITAGVGGSKQGPSIAGSVNFNIINNNTQSYLGTGTKATVNTGGATITAMNTLTSWTIAGVVSASVTGRVAVGAAIDLGILDETVKAFIGSGVTLTAPGDIKIFAANTDNLHSIGAAVAAALGGNVGASGSAAAQSLTPEIEASIGIGAQVSTNSSLRLDADDNTSVLAIAGAGAGGKTAGVGLSVAVSNIDRSVKAFIGDNAVVSAKGNGAGIADPQGKSLGGNGITLDATTTDNRPILFAAGVAGSTGTLAVAASAVVNIIQGAGTQAFIGKGAKINQSSAGAATNQSVQILASHTIDSISVAGSFAGASTAGIGPAANVQAFDKTVKAYIDSSATAPTTVNAANNVIVNATSRDTILAIAAGLGGAATLGIAGSANVLTLKTNTEASIGEAMTIFAAGNLSLAADRDARLKSIAGAGGFGGTGGIGASNSTIVATDTTQAFIGKNASLLVLGNRPALAVFTGLTTLDGKDITTNVTGLALTATSHTDLLTIAVGGAGAGTAGIAGSATVNLLTPVTLAYIDQGTTVTDLSSVRGNSGVYLLAYDQTKIISTAGAIGVGLSAVGIGAGADVGVITKNTQAYIAASSNINVNQDIRILANSREDILSVGISAGVSPGGFGGIAGGAGVYTLDTTTYAFIGQNATVKSNGNIVISADDTTKMSLFAGTVSFSGQGVAVGASAGVTVLDKDTQAYISQGATVDALANNTISRLVPNGTFNITYGPNSSNPGDIRAPAMDNADAVKNANQSIFKQRTATPQSSSLQGIAVTATNQDAIEHLAAGGSAAFAAAIQVAGSVNVTKTNTKAFIGDSAKVNTASGAGAGQSVRVAAGNDLYYLGIAGVLGIAVGGGVNPGANVTVVSNTTGASIGNSAQVNAKKDVAVIANATEDISAIAIAAGGGTIGVAGAVSVFSVNNNTQATIGQSAKVNANGNVLVTANDDTSTSIIAGGLGVGALGFGASVGVTLIAKNTQAYIDGNAIVNAKGNSGLLTVFDGNSEIGADSIATKTIQGLAVQASSSETAFTVAIGGSGGFIGSVAGAVSVEVIKSDTTAFIGDSAKINLDSTGANAAQSVNVSAVNRVKVFVVDGSIAGAIGGLAGGVDVGVIGNNTIARIAGGAQVNAKQDVEVNALAKKKVESYAASGAAGVVGIAGAVTVYGIGANLDSDAQRSLKPNDSGNTATTGGYVDGQILDSLVSNALGSYQSSGSDSTQQVASAASATKTSLDNAVPKGQVSNIITGSTPVQGVTQAIVGSSGNATINADRNVSVNARERIDLNLVAGSGTLAGVAFGGAVGIANVNSNITAYTLGTVNAGGTVGVTADFDENLTGKAYAGTGGLVGLGAQVILLNDTSSQSASVLGNVAKADTLSINATPTRTLTAESIGGGIAGVVAGTSIARTTVGGSTVASLGANAKVGQETGTFVENLSILADSNTTATSTAQAVAAGLASGAGADAQASVTPTITARIETGAAVKVTNNVSLLGRAQESAIATAKGVNVGGANAGVSLARATTSPTVSAYIDKAAIVNAGGDVSIRALAYAPGKTNATTSGGGVISGAGADAKSVGSPIVRAFTGDGSRITAGQDIRVRVGGGSSLSADALTPNYSLVRLGAAIAAVESTPDINATIGADSVLQAGRDIDLATIAYFDDGQPIINGSNAAANAVSQSLGISATATTFSRVFAITILGKNAQLQATRNISISSNGQAYPTDASASSPIGGLFDPNGRATASTRTITIARTLLRTAVIDAGNTVSLSAQNSPTIYNVASAFGPLKQQKDELTMEATVESGLEFSKMKLTAGNLNVTALSAATYERTPETLDHRDTISLNSDIFIKGIKENRELFIDRNGNVVNIPGKVNLKAEVVGDDVIVDDVNLPQQKPKVSFDVRNGSLQGATIINVDPVRLGEVSITNASYRNLVLNRVNMLATTLADAVSITYNAKTAQTGNPSTGGKAYDALLTRSLPVDSQLKIRNTNSQTNIIFRQPINLEAGEMQVSTFYGGSILADNANVVLTAGRLGLNTEPFIEPSVTDDGIGTATQPLQLNLVPSSFRQVTPPYPPDVDVADLSVSASGDIYLAVKGLPFYGATPVTPERKKVDQVNLNLTSLAGSIDATIATVGNSLINSQNYITAIANKIGTPNEGNITLNAGGPTPTSLYLREVAAANGSVVIEAGDLVDVNPLGPALRAKTATLGGSRDLKGIGTAATPFKTQVETFEKISAKNFVSIANEGELTLKLANVANGIRLTTTGLLTIGDGQPPYAILATGGSIELISGSGGITTYGRVISNNGDVSLTAVDTAASNDNILVFQDRITAGNNLSLSAGDAVEVRAFASLGAKTLSITTDSFNADSGVIGLVNLTGSLKNITSSIFIVGGLDRDEIILRGETNPQATMTINTGDGDDNVELAQASGPTTIDLGGGNDRILVGVPFNNNRTGSFGALTVRGGIGTDRLLVNDSGNPSPINGSLTVTKITGLNPNGITYEAMEALEIDLSNADNIFKILSQIPDTTVRGRRR